MRRATTTGVLALVLLTACSGGGDGTVDSTGAVCDDFAGYVQDGMPADQRSDVVSGIGDLIGNADQGVQDAYEVVTNSVDGPDSQWQLAADTFAQSCFDAGWEG